MSRTLGVCWIFLWITAAANATYVLSNETASWQYAKNTGNFATPTIQINTSNFSIIVNTTSDLNENQTAWIGYYKKETAFAYITHMESSPGILTCNCSLYIWEKQNGCSLLNDIVPNFEMPKRNNSPGMCLSMCNRFRMKYMYIGLNGKRCFCLSEKPSENIHVPNCNKSYNGSWMTGGVAGYMSIYQKMKTDMNGMNGINNQKSGDCLAFEPSNLYWSGCQLRYRALCIKDSQVVKATSQHSEQYVKWKYYVQICFENGCSPLTFNDTTRSSLQNTTGQIWTNVIRSDVIYKYHEASNSISGSSGKHGYVTKSGNITILSFTENSTTRLYFLQTLPVTKPTTNKMWMSTNIHVSQNYTTSNITNNITVNTRKTSQAMRTVSTSGFTSSPTGHSTHTISSSTTPSSQKISIPPMNDGSMNNTEGFQSKNKKGTSDSSNVSIPVSVSVVAIIFVAVVVLVLILKRRGKFQGICAKNSALENLSSKRNADKIQAKNNVYKESPVDDYEQISDLKDNNNEDVKPDIGVENGNYGHTYFILEPGSRESHTDGDMSDSRNNETEMNDDYNTLHSTKNFGTKADDTYDTTEKAAIKLKTLHDTGCEKESPEKLNGNEEDTYNHISRNLLKNNKTDNIYGVTDNQEDDYGDVHNGCEKNRHNGDDTYSHLNTTH